MDFLALCQRLRSESGISGSGPTAVTGQVGEMERVVNWINQAWMDIQSINPDWPWLRKSFSFVTVDGQATYTPADCGITDFGVWVPDTRRIYETSVGLPGEQFLSEMDYECWRNTYQFSANRDQRTMPVVVTETPDTSLGIGPTPGPVGYTVTGDYFAEPSEMVLATDVPVMPAKHHMIIVYRAMMYYGGFESAPEVYQRGEAEFNKLRRRMERDRMPMIGVAGALA